jgi:exopolysaccharide production protein ExoZ
MEGLRGFAVFLVFLVHYMTLVQPWILQQTELLRISIAIHTIGNAGVDLFFVLSGYLIYGSLISRNQPFWRFIGRRVKRIYPAFTVVFFVYVGLSYLFPESSKIPPTVIDSSLYLLQNFLLLPGLFPMEPMITVAWSLSYEMFYYLAIPLLIGTFGLRRCSVIWRIKFFVIIALANMIYCTVFPGHVRLNMFISGILLFDVMALQKLRPTPGFVGLGALVIGLFAMTLPIQGANGAVVKSSILFIAFFLLCLACFRSASAWLPRTFAWTPLRWLGNMSYSYYLLHGLALKAAFLMLSGFLPPYGHNTWIFWLMLPVMFFLTLIPTTALFLAVERPLSLASK